MTLIGFGDVITAVCLPRQKNRRIDKDFDESCNAKMLANMLANFVQVPDFLTYASEIYDIWTKILWLQQIGRNSTQKAPFSIIKIPAKSAQRDLAF